ncbi:MAG: choice-of-anchor K domain-containing protein [Nitrospirales bacterium]
MKRKLLLIVGALGFSLTLAPAVPMAQTVGSGTSGGEFVNPTPSCPPATCSGLGTSSIFFGDPDPGNPPNGLAFTGRGFSVPVGVPFVLGLLQFQNSSTINSIDAVDIRLHTAALNGDPLFTRTITENLTLAQTVNTGNPESDADFIFLTRHPEFGSFRVFEGQVSSVEMLGIFTPLSVAGFGQTFDLGFVGWGQVGSPNVAFVNPSVTSAAVPEPSTWLLLGSGLGLGALQKIRARMSNRD